MLSMRLHKRKALCSALVLIAAAGTACNDASAMSRRAPQSEPAAQATQVVPTGASPDSAAAPVAGETAASTAPAASGLPDVIDPAGNPVTPDHHPNPGTGTVAGHYDEGYKLGKRNGDIIVARLRKKTVEKEGCSAVPELQQALITVTRSIRPSSPNADGDLVRGFYRGYIDSVGKAIRNVRKNCGVRKFSEGSFPGRFYGSVVCQLGAVDRDTIAAFDLGPIYGGWSGGSAEIQDGCRSTLLETTAGCELQAPAGLLDPILEHGCGDLSDVSDDEEDLESLLTSKNVTEYAGIDHANGRGAYVAPRPSSVCPPGLVPAHGPQGLICVPPGGTAPGTPTYRPPVANPPHPGGPGHGGPVYGGNPPPPGPGFHGPRPVRLRPAIPGDEDDVHAADVVAQSFSGQDCARAGEALVRLSNNILSTSYEMMRLPPNPGAVDPTGRRKERTRQIWERRLKSPKFWQVLWQRLADAYRSCDRACFDDGTAIGQLSGTAYCSASIGVGGLDSPGFLAQGALPVCQTATFVGCQSGYQQAASGYPGCSTFTSGSYDATYKAFQSQDCHME